MQIEESVSQFNYKIYDQFKLINEPSSPQIKKCKLYVIIPYDSIEKMNSLGGWIYRLLDNSDIDNSLDTGNFYISLVSYKMLPGQNCNGHTIHGKEPVETLTPNSVVVYVIPNNKYKNILKEKLRVSKDANFRLNIETYDKINDTKIDNDPNLFKINLDRMGRNNFRKLITIDNNSKIIEFLNNRSDSLILGLDNKIADLKVKRYHLFINPQAALWNKNLENNLLSSNSNAYPVFLNAGINHNLSNSNFYYGAAMTYIFNKMELKQTDGIIKEGSKEFNTDNDGEFYQRITYADNIQEIVKFQFASLGATIGLNIHLQSKKDSNKTSRKKDKYSLSIEYCVSVPIVHTFTSVNNAGTYTTGGIYPNYLANDTLFSSKPNFVKSQQFDKTNTKLNYVPQIMHRIGISLPIINKTSFIISLIANYNYTNFQNMNIRDELFGSDPGSKYFSLLTTQNNLRIQNISLGCNFKYKF